MRKNKKGKKCCYNCQYLERETLFCNRFDLDLQTKKKSYKFYCIEFLFLYNKKITQNKRNYIECIKELKRNL